jgi:glycosyltransferase involved in cell wall biosynthesis
VTAEGQPGGGGILAPQAPSGLEPPAEPPAFSVVIPAYQAAETIAVAVQSALDQVQPAHEVIVVDDGSTDDLAGALRPFGDRIEVVRKENGGAASARNAGAEVAGGEFMAVLDADDRFHPRRIEALSRLASLRPDLDLVTTDARFVIDGEAAGSFLAENPFATGDQRRAILKSCFVGGWPAARISRLREVGGFDEDLRVGHDWDCWLRMILGGSAAGLVDLPYYDYVLAPGGLTSGRVESLWDRVRMLEKATVNPALGAEERPALKRELRRRRSDAVREETREQLESGLSRRRLLRLAGTSGAEARARAGAALALAVPPLARRLVEARRSPEERLTNES